MISNYMFSKGWIELKKIYFKTYTCLTQTLRGLFNKKGLQILKKSEINYKKLKSYYFIIHFLSLSRYLLIQRFINPPPAVHKVSNVSMSRGMFYAMFINTGLDLNSFSLNPRHWRVYSSSLVVVHDGALTRLFCDLKAHLGVTNLQDSEELRVCSTYNTWRGIFTTRKYGISHTACRSAFTATLIM